jgi:hypothetical protein
MIILVIICIGISLKVNNKFAEIMKQNISLRKKIKWILAYTIYITVSGGFAYFAWFYNGMVLLDKVVVNICQYSIYCFILFITAYIWKNKNLINHKSTKEYVCNDFYTKLFIVFYWSVLINMLTLLTTSNIYIMVVTIFFEAVLITFFTIKFIKVVRKGSW